MCTDDGGHGLRNIQIKRPVVSYVAADSITYIDCVCPTNTRSPVHVIIWAVRVCGLRFLSLVVVYSFADTWEEREKIIRDFTYHMWVRQLFAGRTAEWLIKLKAVCAGAGDDVNCYWRFFPTKSNETNLLGNMELGVMIISNRAANANKFQESEELGFYRLNSSRQTKLNFLFVSQTFELINSVNITDLSILGEQIAISSIK